MRAFVGRSVTHATSLHADNGDSDAQADLSLRWKRVSVGVLNSFKTDVSNYTNEPSMLMLNVPWYLYQQRCYFK